LQRVFTRRLIVWIGGRALDPNLAAFEVLVLPYRCDLLHALDRISAGGKRVSSMSRRRGDHDADLSDREPADSMMNRELDSGPAFGGLVANPHECRSPQRCVRFIVQPQHSSANVVISHHTHKRRDRSARRRRDRRRNCSNVQRVGGYGETGHLE